MAGILPSEALVSLVFQVQVTRLATVASIAAFVYDYLLTLPQEVSLVWPTPWSFMKIAFLLQRYLPFFDSILFFILQNMSGVSEAACGHHLQAAGIMFTIGTFISETILALRVWSVWGNTRKMAIFLILFYIFIILFALVPMAYVFHTVTIQTLPYPRLSCIVTGDKYVYSLCWFAFALCNSVMLILMIIPAMQCRQSCLLKVVYRDGITYYIYMTALSIVNIVIVLAAPEVIGFGLLIALERFLHSLLTSRVVLNIRSQVAKSSGIQEIYHASNNSVGFSSEIITTRISIEMEMTDSPLDSMRGGTSRSRDYVGGSPSRG
ncbi:hypothetical protein BDN72DRAFT_838415 [Pluteus cervinus]|uniref:Uncharacterized protein n=1 Tax=Pluteus cervinus TaxID=181527 RepID=A0ACD3AYW8_9AGAR|nr:hypothetical protein BDN72DRAFT_838415 [Pluteus cervinus]